MAYYTERHGMRRPVAKTYDISIEKYALLLHCCEKYYNNLAWKYPEQCPDGYGCCGIDFEQLRLDLRYEIPTLYRDYSDNIAVPTVHHNVFDSDDAESEYDQYALLDLIEFFAENLRDVVVGSFHSYFGHYHLTCQNSRNVCVQFRDEINSIFQKTGLLYELNTDLQVERIVENSPLTPAVESAIAAVKEAGARELLQEAILLHRSPNPADIRNAVEKLWDAYERLKTYYTTMNKAKSAEKIVNDMAAGQAPYVTLFDTEFRALTKIGNDFRIRHHETDKVEITDVRYYDYFFNRCLSLIALAIQYLQ